MTRGAHKVIPSDGGSHQNSRAMPTSHIQRNNRDPYSRRIALFGTLLLTFVIWMSARAQQPGQPAPPPPEPQQAAPESPLQSGYTIQRSVDLVVLHVSVTDERGQFVPGLKEENFRVFEDDSEQKIAVLRQEDTPVSMGLLIDNSGSMFDQRDKVNAPPLTFRNTSNP